MRISEPEKNVTVTPENDVTICRVTGLPYPHPATERSTALKMIMMPQGHECFATDGCLIEPDGVCGHGHPGWLLYLGLI